MMRPLCLAAVTVNSNLHGMTSVPSTRVAHVPNWFESLLFLALMSGPPKFRARDAFASLEGAIDLVVLIHIAVWTCGGLWVLARLYPAALRRGVVPPLNPAQAIGALFIAALTLSLSKSPGILLTAFALGQFAVMLGFLWVFTHRFGTSACLRHQFIGVSVLALAIVAAILLAPGLVTGEPNGLAGGTGIRVGGGYIAGTGGVAVIGLVFCLSSAPQLRGPMFWGALSLFGGLLVVSRTRSAYLAFLVFLAIGVTYGKRLRVRKLVVPLAALTFIVVLMDAVSSTTAYLVRERESVETMSDRIPLWQHLTSVVMQEAPITGLGYYAASRVLGTEYRSGLGNAHSAFVEVLVGGGVLGAALHLMLCASLVWFAVHLLWVASGHPTAVAVAGLLSVTLLIGVTSESALNAGPLGFAFWSLTALLPRLLREAAPAGLAGAQRLHVRQSTLGAGAGGRVAVMNRQPE
jgi:O-antigen ligase